MATLEIEEDADGELEVRTTSSRRKRSKKTEDEGAPVENDEPIPLFPHLNKNKENVVTEIRVFKRDPPGDGYKGSMPPTADLDFMAKRWGNGIYDIEAINSEHVVLRRTQNIVINSIKPTAPSLPGAAGGDVAERLLDRQAQSFERDQARADGLARAAIESTREQARSYAEMVRADTESRMQRDREYFAQMALQQREAFQQQLLQTQQLHTMTMDSQRASFQQVLSLMSATHERELQTNNPVVMLEVLQRGFQMASELGGGDQDPLTTAMQTGLGGLRELTKMMALQKATKSSKLAKSNPAAKPQSAPKSGENGNTTISRKELLEVQAVKKLAEKKGYDFEGILAQAKSMVEAAPDQNDDPEESDESDDNDDSEESRASDVDGGKPSH